MSLCRIQKQFTALRFINLVHNFVYACPLIFLIKKHRPHLLPPFDDINPGGVVLPYMGYIGMCRCEGYGFQAVYSRTGYINKSVWVQNRVSFFRKQISWLLILSRPGKQLLQDRGGGIWGVYSSIGQQNLAELALVQVKGSRVPAALPLPEIPKVPPPPGQTKL